MAKRQILIEVDEKDYQDLKKKIKKTRHWIDEHNNVCGDRFLLCNDPEYFEGKNYIFIEASIVMELDETT